jgi:sugar O-acyltransferase (sialic acid O-acetyltransferase NeuD family)
MNRVIVVGAGSLGREVLGWIPSCQGFGSDWSFAGFLNEGSDSLRERGYEEPILGTPEAYVPQPEDRLVIAVAEPRDRLRLAGMLEGRGAHFATLIHNSVILSRHVVIGAGSILCPRVVVSCDANIGQHVIVNLQSTVGHDTVVGDGCTLSAHCDITGGVKLGRGVFLGSHANVLPGVEVGDFARLGAGSAILRNVPAETTVVGVPAKKLVFTGS